MAFLKEHRLTAFERVSGRVVGTNDGASQTVNPGAHKATDMDVTIVVPAGKKVRLNAKFTAQANRASGTPADIRGLVLIYRYSGSSGVGKGNTPSGGTLIYQDQWGRLDPALASGGAVDSIGIENWRDDPGAGTWTYEISVATSDGTLCQWTVVLASPYTEQFTAELFEEATTS